MEEKIKIKSFTDLIAWDVDYLKNDTFVGVAKQTVKVYKLLNGLSKTADTRY